MSGSVKALPGLAIPPVVDGYRDAQLRALQADRGNLKSAGASSVNSKLTGSVGKNSEVEQQKAAEQFEALLLQEMFKSMWATVPKGSLISGSQEEAYYRDMLNEALAESVSRGQGLGIKEVITKEFKAQEAEGKSKEK